MTASPEKETLGIIRYRYTISQVIKMENIY